MVGGWLVVMDPLLPALVLNRYGNAGWEMRNPHCRVGCVHALTSVAATAVYIYFEIFFVDL
jgi:hypothetical protein